MSAPYGIAVSTGQIDAWATTRLSYEPKGWMVGYRDELRRALRDLPTSPGTHLSATYFAPDEDFADVENVLFYNVGASNYGHLTEMGIECLRAESPDELHRVRYEVVSGYDDKRYSGEPVAEVALDSIPKGWEKPAPWWVGFRPRLVTNGAIPEGRGAYSISVELDPSRVMPGIAGLVKPMLDGLISALHSHDGSNIDRLAPVLSKWGDVDALWLLLNDPAKAILGQRQLLRPHGEGVAWNPADELCWAFRVRLASGLGAGLLARVYPL